MMKIGHKRGGQRAASVGAFAAILVCASVARADMWFSGTNTIYSGSATRVGIGTSIPSTVVDIVANQSGREAFRVNQLQGSRNIAEFQSNGTTEVLIDATGFFQGNNGVAGVSTTAVAVSGESTSGPGVYGSSSSSNGVLGQSHAPPGSDQTAGVYGAGFAASGVGVSGRALGLLGVGVYGRSDSGNGVVAQTAVTDMSAAAVSAIPGSTSALAYWGGGGIQLLGSFAEKASGTAWTNPSDRRIKKDVKDFERGLSELTLVRPVTFKFNGLGGTEDDGKEHVGVIAQELEQVLPSMVGSKTVKLHKDDVADTKLKLVDASEFTFLLINAVKEQQRTIQKQDARIAALERHQAPATSSLLSGGAGAAMGFILMPVGLFAARQRRKLRQQRS